ncbi:uncharacterized protein CTHT_0067120 [Thermochaetoides thermophila DSM 1495]|uniref:BTB domain-containing protein n=1 Tax=Chaetomium thermophilum (strain DSM 1495 / CBS 144.50 / IMI 039719) TaxID=759272 RepID=G0SGP8_CHATD|nr:hypothetical protein CTHT_0067120 [Thermochaetoides thermophila DSM 1495]EGS17387.1 hypothetical protein CTHT_0067120 [Thermochaetoides thermophila DSM 1495]
MSDDPGPNAGASTRPDAGSTATDSVPLNSSTSPVLAVSDQTTQRSLAEDNASRNANANASASASASAPSSASTSTSNNSGLNRESHPPAQASSSRSTSAPVGNGIGSNTTSAEAGPSRPPLQTLADVMRAPSTVPPDVVVLESLPDDLERRRRQEDDEEPDPKADLWVSTYDGRFNSPIIPIHVGVPPNNATFYVHKHILLRCEYFEKALCGDFKESEAQAIDLPEEDPALFHFLVAYLYEGKYEPIKPLAAALAPDRKGKSKAAAPSPDSNSTAPADPATGPAAAAHGVRPEHIRRLARDNPAGAATLILDRLNNNANRPIPNYGGGAYYYPPVYPPAVAPPVPGRGGGCGTTVLLLELWCPDEEELETPFLLLLLLLLRRPPPPPPPPPVPPELYDPRYGGEQPGPGSGTGQGIRGEPQQPQEEEEKKEDPDRRSWTSLYTHHIRQYLLAHRFLLPSFQRAVARAIVLLLESLGSQAATMEVLQSCRTLYDGLPEGDPLVRMVFARVGFLQPWKNPGCGRGKQYQHQDGHHEDDLGKGKGKEKEYNGHAQSQGSLSANGHLNPNPDEHLDDDPESFLLTNPDIALGLLREMAARRDEDLIPPPIPAAPTGNTTTQGPGPAPGGPYPGGGPYGRAGREVRNYNGLYQHQQHQQQAPLPSMVRPLWVGEGGWPWGGEGEEGEWWWHHHHHQQQQQQRQQQQQQQHTAVSGRRRTERDRVVAGRLILDHRP